MSSPTAAEMDAAGLTAEELAAIQDEHSPGELAALKAVAEAAAATDDDDDGDDDGDGESKGAPPVEGKAEATAGDGKPATDAAGTETKTELAPTAAATTTAASTDTNTDVQDTGIQPSYTVKLPADFDERLAKLKTEESDIRAKFKAGEIDLDAYEEKRDAIASQRDELNGLRIKAEVSQEMTTQNVQTAWQNTINNFFRDTAKAGGTDYRSNKALNDDLDGFIKQLASKEEYDDKPMAWFLLEAHKRVNALHGIGTPAPAATDTTTKEEKLPASRKPPVAAVPQTLATVPGGDGPGDVAGEFAHLDALEGEELETALGKMTPAAREKFSRGL